jgi:uncharacterized protein YjbJ (UPF0337 family)
LRKPSVSEEQRTQVKNMATFSRTLPYLFSAKSFVYVYFHEISARPLHHGLQPNLEDIMAREDEMAGKVKQIKGKANDVVGAVRGNTAQQIKGKIQKGVGKVQEAIGKADRKNAR